jgi:hypothetical protein
MIDYKQGCPTSRSLHSQPSNSESIHKRTTLKESAHTNLSHAKEISKKCSSLRTAKKIELNLPGWESNTRSHARQACMLPLHHRRLTDINHTTISSSRSSYQTTPWRASSGCWKEKRNYKIYTHHQGVEEQQKEGRRSKKRTNLPGPELHTGSCTRQAQMLLLHHRRHFRSGSVIVEMECENEK